MLYSIIIPAYNEEKRIGKTLSAYGNYFLRKNCEIIVICDGTDKTWHIAKDMGKKYRIKAARFKTRLGKGGAILAGFDAANGKFIGFTDADSSVKPEGMEKLFGAAKNYDCVIGSRRVAGSKVKTPFTRRALRVVFNFLIRIVFSLNIKDTQCGAKVLRAEAVNAIKKEIYSRGFEFDVELLWRLKKKGFKILEAPVDWEHHKNSKFSFMQGLNMGINTLKLRLIG